MTGYTVHTGATEKFSEGWDRIFQSGKKPSASRKSRKQSSAKKSSGKKKSTGRAGKSAAKKKKRSGKGRKK